MLFAKAIQRITIRPTPSSENTGAIEALLMWVGTPSLF